MSNKEESSLGANLVMLFLACASLAGARKCTSEQRKNASEEKSTYIEHIKSKNGHDSAQNNYRVNSPCEVVIDQFDENTVHPTITVLNFCDTAATVSTITERYGYRTTYYDTTLNRTAFENTPVQIVRTADSLLHLKK